MGKPVSNKRVRGIEKAKAAGRYTGRRPGATNRHPTIANPPLEAIKMSAAGKTYKEIAQALGVSINTVSRYVRRKELTCPDHSTLGDLGIEIEDENIVPFNSLYALRALLTVYDIASSWPDAVTHLLDEIKTGPDPQQALGRLIGVGFFGDFEQVLDSTKLPPRPEQVLRGVSEVDFFKIVKWASDAPDLARRIVDGQYETNGEKIESLLRCANEGTKHVQSTFGTGEN